jgi:hypothetical protein
MRTGHILDWRRTRQEVVLQKFGPPVKARFNPFLDSAGCTIVMRWQPRVKSNFSEDQTLFFETLPRSRSHSLRAIFRRATNQPAIQIRRAYVKWKEIFLMPAQRFGERQVPWSCTARCTRIGINWDKRQKRHPSRGTDVVAKFQ